MDAPDVIVLGGGPAGYACALRLADCGLSVTVVEAAELGGTCLHRGCVPTRAMLEGASIVDTVTRRAERWGVHAVVEKVDFARLLATRDEVVHRNHVSVAHHLERAKVEVVHGYGRLTGPRTIAVAGGGTLSAERAIVLAAGSVVRRFERIHPDGVAILTTDHAFALDHVPRSALILGGGAVGAEMSQVWRALGAEVTILEREDRLVPFEDAAVGAGLARALRRRGIRSVTGIHVEDVRPREAAVEVDVTHGGRTETMTAEVLLLAAGRTPATAGIGLEDVGVALDGAYVRVSEAMETSVRGVYAAGDLLGPPSHMRANAAFVEGMVVADRIAGAGRSAVDYSQVPRVTHGMTETACVGLSEEKATAQGLEPRAATMPLAGVAMGAIAGEPGFAKVVAAGDGTVVGVHLVGPRATELIGGAAAVTTFEASVAEAATIVHAHPTLAEAIQELYLAESGRPLHLRG